MWVQPPPGRHSHPSGPEPTPPPASPRPSAAMAAQAGASEGAGRRPDAASGLHASWPWLASAVRRRGRCAPLAWPLLALPSPQCERPREAAAPRYPADLILSSGPTAATTLPEPSQATRPDVSMFHPPIRGAKVPGFKCALIQRQGGKGPFFFVLGWSRGWGRGRGVLSGSSRQKGEGGSGPGVWSRQGPARVPPCPVRPTAPRRRVPSQGSQGEQGRGR